LLLPLLLSLLLLLLLLLCCMQPAPSVTVDAADLEASSFINPGAAIGLLIGAGAAGVALMQKKETEVRHSPADNDCWVPAQVFAGIEE
jgi:hypothetical protein